MTWKDYTYIQCRCMPSPRTFTKMYMNLTNSTAVTGSCMWHGCLYPTNSYFPTTGVRGLGPVRRPAPVDTRQGHTSPPLPVVQAATRHDPACPTSQTHVVLQASCRCDPSQTRQQADPESLQGSTNERPRIPVT